MTRQAVACGALLWLACPAPPAPPAPLAVTGDDWRFEADDAGVLRFSREGVELLALGPGALQLGTVRALDPEASYDPYWLVVNDGVFSPTPPPGFRWRTVTSAAPSVVDGALQLQLTFEGDVPATVTVRRLHSGAVLEFMPGASPAAPIAFLRVRLTADDTEAFYGLGEWFDAVNHRGKLRPMQLEPDLNVESAATENHVAVPFLLGSRGWGVFVESRRHGVFDVAKSDPRVVDTMWGTAEASAAGLRVHFFSAQRPLEVLREYHEVAGAPGALTSWAHGPWLWRDETLGQAEVEDDVRQLRALDLPTSGCWIDRPYATEVNTFDFDPTKYPDAGGMVDTFHAAGLRLALWHTPYLAAGAQPLRGEADANGYFPPSQGAWLNRWSPPLDFTNPAAEAAWRSLVARYVQAGVEGFKLDFAEDVVAGLSGRRGGWTFSNGETDRTMTDGYPRRYHEAYASQLPGERFLLVRHARWGEQALGVVVWPGDIDATLTRFGERFTTRGGDEVVGVGGLPAAIRAGVGLSMSGFPYFASDTGGYRHSPPDKETWVRWVQHAALMPVMQTGDSSSQPPWRYTPENGRDAEALDAYRALARLHLRLYPYFVSAPTPVVRPFGLQFPALGRHPEDVYLLGDALFVAPVETRGAATKTFPKPPGRWFSWWDGAELPGADGEDVTVPAPLLTLPLYLREGALVPMLRPSIDTLAPTAADAGVDSFADDTGTLWVRAQPGTGAFTAVGVSLSQAPGVLTASQSTTDWRDVVWELKGVARPALVTHAGGALAELPSVAAVEQATQGFAFDGTTLWVKTPLDGAPTELR